ncbi:MAG: FAD-dependent oxidoreductase [Caulobacteraceae bacterium]|nr:FAD-dependent oxidoreductase [Caulobacter sp.]
MRRGDTHDVIVVGAGSAGLTAAGGLAQLGLRVALVERAVMGGECLTTGCVPSKALLAAARRARDMREADEVGVAAAAPAPDLGRAMAHVRAAQAAIAPRDSERRYAGWGVEVVRGSARFTGPRSLEVDGRRLAAPRIVLAVGSRPALPPLPGLEATPFLTTETVWSLETLPPRLLILGGGSAGLELAQAFARLGSRVTVVESGRALSHDDPAAAAVVLTRLAAEGVDVREAAPGRRVDADAGGEVRLLLETGEILHAERLLVATGREAVVDGLDLARANVRVGDDGIEVDAARRTSNRRIYAIGDCRAGPRFSHVAGYEGARVVSAIGLGFSSRVDFAALPRVTYTDPELAQVGLTEAEARRRFGEVETSCASFAENDRAVVEAATEGFVKLVRARGRLRGATVVGKGAGDLLLPLGLCIGGKASVSALAGVIAPYPTRGEAAKEAAYVAFQPLLYGRWMRRWARMLRLSRR